MRWLIFLPVRVVSIFARWAWAIGWWLVLAVAVLAVAGVLRW